MFRIFVYFLLLFSYFFLVNAVDEIGIKRQNSFDLNKTASSGGGGAVVHKEQGEEEEVQSKPHNNVEESLPITRWGNKRPREARQPRRDPIVSIILKKPRIAHQVGKPRHTPKPRTTYVREKPEKPSSGLYANGECETHQRGCPHWEGLSQKERNKHSSRLSRRREIRTAEGKERARIQFKKYYTNLTPKQKKEKIKIRWKREKELEKELTPEQLTKKRAMHNRDTKNWRLRLKGLQDQEDSE